MEIPLLDGISTQVHPKDGRETEVTNMRETNARDGRPPRRRRIGTIPMAGIAVTCAAAAFAMPAMAATMAAPLVESMASSESPASEGTQTEANASLTAMTASQGVSAVADAASASVEDVLRAADAPFSNALQTEMVPLLSSDEKIDAAKVILQNATDAELTLDGKQVNRDDYLTKLETARTKLDYLTANADKVASSVITLSQLGDRYSDQGRTYQSFPFDNADLTGFYIRPGIKAKFRVYVDGDSTTNLTWAHRQVGRVDTNNYAVVRADDGGILKPGVNEIEYDTTARTVGQVLYIRNDGKNAVRVRIEGSDADATHPVTGTSLGQYPYYIYDAQHPEAFWTYLQELRKYVEAGVDQKVGDIVADTSLGMDVSAVRTGRMTYEMRAAKAVDAFKDIQDEQAAVDYVKNMVSVSEGRLEYFDHIQGFDKDDTDTRQQPSKLYVFEELTQNLSNPSTMFAWYTMYHMPESVFPGVATSVEGSHGWGNDHEFGHVIDIQRHVITEETNNLFSIWGRRIAQIEASKKAGTDFSISTYHSGVTSATTQYENWLNQSLSGQQPDSKWGDIWYDVTVRYDFLRYFDDYDYSGYDFDNSPYTKELADQVNKYGGLGAVYRQMRRNMSLYNGRGTDYNAFNDMVRAYSDALGFDMAEALGRTGLTGITDNTKAYAARYPKLPQRVEFYTIKSDAAGINGAQQYDASTKAPNVSVSRTGSDTISITASYAADSVEAKSTTAYVLLADGKEIAYSPTGQFTVQTPAELPKYTVVAYDYRVNPSPEALVRTSADVDVKVVVVGGDAKATDATIRVKSDDPRVTGTSTKVAGATTTIKGITPATLSVSLDGYTAYPSSTHVDTITWTGGSIQFTLVKDGGDVKVGQTLRPVITGAETDGGQLAFSITDPNTGGSDIYYTLDGSEPTSTNGIRWTGGLVTFSTSPVTIKARAYKAKLLPSDVASSTFTDSRVVGLYTDIYGPQMGVGKVKWYGIGEYKGQEALDFLYDNVRALKVPDGLKVTLYEGENLDGTKHEYTQTVNWVNGYDAFPIKSVRVETVKPPTAEKAGIMSFDSNAIPNIGSQPMGSMSMIQMYKGIDVTVPDVKYTLSGYTAAGYKKQGTDEVVMPGTKYTPDGSNVILSVQWVKAPFTVAFDANGGTGTMASMTSEVGGETTFPANAFTRKGYKFAGWKLPDGTHVDDGGRVTIAGTKEGDIVTASAQWNAIRYSVEFAAGDGATGSMTGLELAYDEPAKLPLNTFTKAGYDFDGWVDGQGRKYADGQDIQGLTETDGGTVTLTAQWRKHEDKPSGGDNQNGGGTDVPGTDNGNENAGGDSGNTDTDDGNHSTSDGESDAGNGTTSGNGSSEQTDGHTNGNVSTDRHGNTKVNDVRDRMVATGDMLIPALVGIAGIAVIGIIVSIILKSRK